MSMKGMGASENVVTTDWRRLRISQSVLPEPSTGVQPPAQPNFLMLQCLRRFSRRMPRLFPARPVPVEAILFPSPAARLMQTGLPREHTTTPEHGSPIHPELFH